MTILIGIDDTDNATSKGTGHMARMLGLEFAARGWELCGITRHQFLLDARIPYTSHNSGACIAIKKESARADLEAVTKLACEFVGGRSAEGSDPGVCVAMPEQVNLEHSTFGNAATQEVLEMSHATALAKRAGVFLRALGGTGQGIIGALASVALRAGGNDGRFIDLPGLREMSAQLTVGGLEQFGIGAIAAAPGPSPQASDTLETLNWVRPRLSGGRAVLPIEWSNTHNAWIPTDRKRSRPLE